MKNKIIIAILEIIGGLVFSVVTIAIIIGLFYIIGLFAEFLRWIF